MALGSHCNINSTEPPWHTPRLCACKLQVMKTPTLYSSLNYDNPVMRLTGSKSQDISGCHAGTYPHWCFVQLVPWHLGTAGQWALVTPSHTHRCLPIIHTHRTSLPPCFFFILHYDFVYHSILEFKQIQTHSHFRTLSKPHTCDQFRFYLMYVSPVTFCWTDRCKCMLRDITSYTSASTSRNLMHEISGEMTTNEKQWTEQWTTTTAAPLRPSLWHLGTIKESVSKG